MRVGWSELLVLLLLVLLLFGAKRLPDLARSLGRSLGEFKKGLRNNEDDARRDGDQDAGGKKSGGGDA